MRTLILMCFIALVGCAGKKPLPPPVAVIHGSGSELSLEDICFSLERLAVQIGAHKIKATVNDTYIEVPPALQGEVVTITQTIYSLPIKTIEDVNAVSRLIYKNCVLKHER